MTVVAATYVVRWNVGAVAELDAGGAEAEAEAEVEDEEEEEAAEEEDGADDDEAGAELEVELEVDPVVCRRTFPAEAMVLATGAGGETTGVRRGEQSYWLVMVVVCGKVVTVTLYVTVVSNGRLLHA